MIRLSDYFPEIRKRKRDTVLELHCRIRRKWLVAQPEEFVRQAAISHLIQLGYSERLISVERQIEVYGMSRRYDIVVWDKNQTAKILVECKAPEVALGEKDEEQVAWYNTDVHAEAIWITNGHQHKIVGLNRQTNQYHLSESLPLPEEKHLTMSDQKIETLPEEQWDYDHFIGFLLLYAAHADLEYSESEKEFILSKISPSLLQKVESNFNLKSDFEQLQTILRLKERFINSDNHKEKVLEEVSELFKSDGDYSLLESNLFEFLKRLL